MLLFGLLFSAVLHSFRLCPALVTLGAEASSCAVPGVLCSPPSLHLQGPRPSLAPASAGSILGRDVVWGPSSGREELGTANLGVFRIPDLLQHPGLGTLGTSHAGAPFWRPGDKRLCRAGMKLWHTRSQQPRCISHLGWKTTTQPVPSPACHPCRSSDAPWVIAGALCPFESRQKKRLA